VRQDQDNYRENHRPGSGEDAIPPEVEVEAGLWVGRCRDHLPRSRSRPSPGVGRGGDRLPRPRRGPSPRVGRGGDFS
jgi:hypothetical protein